MLGEDSREYLMKALEEKKFHVMNWVEVVIVVVYR